MPRIERLRAALRRRLFAEVVREANGRGGIVFFGSHPWRLTLIRRAFDAGTPPATRFVPIGFNLVSRARAAAKRYGVAVIANPPTRLREALDTCGLRVPRFVAQRQDIPADEALIRGRLGGHSLRDNLRLVRKHKYEWSTSDDHALFGRFYEEFYVPTVMNRHADEGKILPRGDIETADGEFLLVSTGDQLVAMSLAHRHEDCYAMSKVGVRGGDASLVKKGALSAVYLFSMLRACQLGYRRISAGLSLPFLNDGVLRHKATWHYGLGIDQEQVGSYYFLFDARHSFAQEFLDRNPLVFLEGTGLSVLSGSASREDDTRFEMEGIQRRVTLGECPQANAALQ